VTAPSLCQIVEIFLNSSKTVKNNGLKIKKSSLFQLEIAGKGVDMISELRDSANVQNCGHQPNNIDEEAVSQTSP
jgi:hypothetical protein